ncbi:hypothetical protein [Brachyspira sp.]|uniref:hypothetical protein n=1 Tax=Brachyspira sp. TaxID=1977261 RepID=UPI00261CCD02|nr:hypothetical protein [Brachyspira sp.]
MLKKILISVFFIMYIVSCNSNTDGTTSASEKYKEPPRESVGLSNFIGIWHAKFPNNECSIIIESEENLFYNDIKVSDIDDLGNDRYKMNIKSDKTFSATLKFTSDSEGTVEDDNFGIGTLLKDK